MKKLSRISLFIFAASSIIFSSCNKEGVGGTSSISGTVLGTDHDFARAEITTISFTNGSSVEHGDYWLLNSPNLAAYYYIWYDNPAWVTNGDPGLQGRTGIPVTFNYSDSNLDLATNTMTEILNTTPVYTIIQTNDILTITSTILGDCPDAEDVTSPFSIDIDQQGQNELLGNSAPLFDEKVYITYGEGEIHDDIEQTSVDGKFRFSNLTKGNYSIFTFSKDTVNGGSIVIEQDFEITKNGENYTIANFEVLF